MSGVVRRSSTESFERIAHLEGRIELLQADLLDQVSLQEAVRTSRPHEVYNLAAQSFVPTSWSQPVLTAEFTAVGVTRMLEAMRSVDPSIRFYQASSSEMFGKVREVPQTEEDAVLPAQPLRRRQGLRALHHGELPRELRPVRGLGHPLQPRVAPARPRVRDAQDLRRRRAHQARAGERAAPRQPGCATRLGLRGRLRPRDVADAAAGRPDDYVIATGITHTIRHACEVAFGHVGLDWEEYVVIDERFLRPAEVDLLVGDASKAERELGWKPDVTFEQMMAMMVDADIARLSG